MTKITKAQEKKDQVLANRKSAFVKKARSLIGQDLSTRYKDSAILEYFDKDLTAEKFAVDVASKEPVGLCIFPMKADAVNEADKNARDYYGKLLATLAEHGGDLDAAFPYPNWNEYSDKADRARKLHNIVSYVTKDDKKRPLSNKQNKRSGHDYHRVVDEEAIERKVAEEMREAALLYDMFIIKLVMKVGPVEKANIEGSHIWGYSFLTVTKNDGSTERWKTQQIVNVSKYGMPFNQWPSRKVK